MLLHLQPCRFHFLVKLPGGHPQHAASEGGQLHQTVGGRHPDGVVPANLMSQRFNVSIGGLTFLGVDHLNVVELALFAGVTLLLVAVKYHHQAAFGEARVAGKPVAQLPPGSVQIVLGLRRQILPGETATWTVDIDKKDTETLYALRRLSKWMGDVYVREPSGSGYWANVTVSFSRKHLETVIPVTLNIARVEGGM